LIEKKVIRPESSYLTKRAKRIKVIDPVYLSKHTRKCYELNQAKNVKNTIKKKLTKREQKIYFQELERQRLREEGKHRRQKQKKSKKQKSMSQKNGRKF